MCVFVKYSLYVVVGLILLISTTNARADDSESMKVVHELFEATGSAELYRETVKKVVDVQIQQNPQIAPFRKVMLEFFEKYMGWESMKADIAKFYIEKFTIQEIEELTLFNKTPLGKKAAKLLPELAAHGAALSQKRVQDNMDELQMMIAEEAERIKVKQE